MRIAIIFEIDISVISQEEQGLQRAQTVLLVKRPHEALKAQGNYPLASTRIRDGVKSIPNSNNGIAAQALFVIQKLYRIEADIRALPPEIKQRVRKKKAKPILKRLKTWLDHALAQVTPSSLTGKALAYMSKQWPSLTVYCDDGRLEIDNNSVERAIRPFVIGRNNWICVTRRRTHEKLKMLA